MAYHKEFDTASHQTEKKFHKKNILIPEDNKVNAAYLNAIPCNENGW
jgi:hypothetical protein